MNGEPLLPLTRDEQELLLALREMPEGRLRDLTTAFFTELLDFVTDPACPDMQADGAPCSTTRMSCDECRRLITVVEGLRARLQPS